MDPEIKTKWLEALRSGRYKQAQRTLSKDADTYCCLGVDGRTFSEIADYIEEHL